MAYFARQFGVTGFNVAPPYRRRSVRGVIVRHHRICASMLLRHIDGDQPQAAARTRTRAAANASMLLRHIDGDQTSTAATPTAGSPCFNVAPPYRRRSAEYFEMPSRGGPASMLLRHIDGDQAVARAAEDLATAASMLLRHIDGDQRSRARRTPSHRRRRFNVAPPYRRRSARYADSNICTGTRFNVAPPYRRRSGGRALCRRRVADQRFNVAPPYRRRSAPCQTGWRSRTSTCFNVAPPYRRRSGDLP